MSWTLGVERGASGKDIGRTTGYIVLYGLVDEGDAFRM